MWHDVVLRINFDAGRLLMHLSIFVTWHGALLELG